MTRARNLLALALLPAFLLGFAAGCGRQVQTDPLAKAIEQTGGSKQPKPAQTDDQQGKPLPRSQLAVLRVTDARLPDLDEQQFQVFLQTLADWAKKVSQRQLEYDVRPAIGVEKYFSDHAGALKESLAGKGPAAFSFDPNGPDATGALQECLMVVNQADVRTYFSDAPPELDTIPKWSEYLTGDLQKKWAAFNRPHPPHPALISDAHPEFSRPGLWRALAENERVDVVVTNVFIAGAERRMDLDRIHRGGLLAGFWSVGKQKKNALGATLVVSVQPVLCRSPFVIDVPDQARPAVAAVYTWRYLQALWQKEPQVLDPLGTAVHLISGNQDR
jgi:hypothetical protein